MRQVTYSRGTGLKAVLQKNTLGGEQGARPAVQGKPWTAFHFRAFMRLYALNEPLTP